MIDVFCVRIGNKYGPEYETYLESKLNHTAKLHWIREPFADGIQLQWNKMLPMSLQINKPIVVMDIDVILTNDYEELFNYPCARQEFVAMPDWWNIGHEAKGYTLNGGFFKYWPADTRYIFDKFMQDPTSWQRHYIENGTTTGPVNGEQYFVEDSIRSRLDLKLMPKAWFTRWCSDDIHKMDLVDSDDWPVKAEKWQAHMTKRYREATGNNYIYLGEEFHPDIKMVHFTSFMNKPHEWKDYSLHV